MIYRISFSINVYWQNNDLAERVDTTYTDYDNISN